MPLLLIGLDRLKASTQHDISTIFVCLQALLSLDKKAKCVQNVSFFVFDQYIKWNKYQEKLDSNDEWVKTCSYFWKDGHVFILVQVPSPLAFGKYELVFILVHDLFLGWYIFFKRIDQDFSCGKSLLEKVHYYTRVHHYRLMNRNQIRKTFVSLSTAIILIIIMNLD